MEYEENLAAADEILGKSEKRLEVADVWSVSEAVDMLVGMRPIVGDPDIDPDRIKRDMRELAYGSIDAKTLPCVGKPKERRVRPAEFIRWAASKGLPIPQRMKALLGEGPARPVERAVDPEPPIQAPDNDDVSPDHDTRGMVAWKREIIGSWPKIAEAHKGKPSARDVIRWLQKHGNRDVLPEGQEGVYGFQWKDEYGTTHTRTYHTVGTALSKLRNDGKIPRSDK